MRKYALSAGLSALAVFAVFAVATIALAPAPVQADSCPPPVSEAHGWASASECAGARIACQNDARDNAEAFCGSAGKEVCAWGDITYSECGLENGLHVVDCIQKYACEATPF